MPLRFEGCLQPAEQVVEGGAEVGQLVAGAGQGEPPVEVSGGDLSCGGGDRVQGSQESAGDPPSAGQGDDGGGQADQGGAYVELPVRGGGEMRGPSRGDRRGAPVEEVGGQQHRGENAEEQSGVEQGELYPEGGSPQIPEEGEVLAQGHQGSPIR
jgi:hypothetical protein